MHRRKQTIMKWWNC